MRLAVHQPNFVPWCGYFAKMRHCDVFVFQDDVQFSRGGYVNRAQVITTKGPDWLTVPVPKGSTGQLIGDLTFVDQNFQKIHRKTLKMSYGKCPHYEDVMSLVDPVFDEPGDHLAQFNMTLIRSIAAYLDIACEFRISSELDVQGQADERLAELAQKLGATVYVSGAGGQNYQDESRFAAVDCRLEVRTYTPIAYEQQRETFVPGLSILDAMFRLGKATRDLLVYS